MDDVTATNDAILAYADQLATNVTSDCGTDSSDEGSIEDNQDEDEDEDENIAIVPQTAPWGSPINPTTLFTSRAVLNAPGTNERGRKEGSKLDVLVESTSRDTGIAASLDGFGHPETEPWLSSRVNEESKATQKSGLFSSHQATPYLFPGSSHTTFADLAPFIMSEDLSLDEDDVFNTWKSSLPASRLVQVAMERGTSGKSKVLTQMETAFDAETAMRLSELFRCM